MVDEAPVEMVAAAPTADEYGDSGVADAQKMMEPCCVSPNPKKQLKAMSVKSWWHIYNVTQLIIQICGIVGICFTLYGIYGKLTKEDIQFLANTSISDQPTLCSTVDPSSDLLPQLCATVNDTCNPVETNLVMHKMEQNPSLNILDGMYVCDILGLVLPMVAWCVLSIPLCCCCPCTMCLLCCKPTWIKKYCSGASAIVQKLSLSLSILTWPVTVGLTVALLYFNFTLDSSQWFMLVSVDFQSHQLDNSLCTYALSECNQYYSVMEPTLLSSQPLNITARDCVSDQEYFTSVSASLHHSLTVGIPALLLTTLQLSLAMFLYRRRRVITGPGYVQLTELPTIISRAPPDATDLH